MGRLQDSPFSSEIQNIKCVPTLIKWVYPSNLMRRLRPHRLPLRYRTLIASKFILQIWWGFFPAQESRVMIYTEYWACTHNYQVSLSFKFHELYVASRLPLTYITLGISFSVSSQLSLFFSREGRAALVTSFGVFKYMAVYSMIQFTTVIILNSVSLY